MERLTLNEAIEHCYEKTDCSECGQQHEQLAKWLEELKECKDLEEQGLLLRLPCKIGDTVYTACSWGIESGVVGSIELISDRIFVNNVYGAMIAEAQNIFLTKEKAEATLAKMEEGKL